MKYKLYKLSNDLSLEAIISDKIDSDIASKILIFEKLVVDEYLKKQTGFVGIDKLGNEIRYNKEIQKLFQTQKEGKSVLIKLTENKRSFYEVLIRNLKEFETQDIYFLILEDKFGKNSRLVDSTFIRLKEINNKFKDLKRYFYPSNNIKIYFVELNGFDNYEIDVIGKYSKLVRND